MIVAGAGSPIGLVGFDFAGIATPPAQVGTAMALVNITGYAATIAVIFEIGLVLDLLTPPGSSHYSAHAFSLAMLVPYPVWLVTGVQIWLCTRRVPGAITACPTHAP
ncbi:MAG TPA: hypothetical protein VFS86_01020 [Rhodanobacteraceae bacterium]|nr:hypothetical protein [Rhodanobacteraceae bacterium]